MRMGNSLSIIISISRNTCKLDPSVPGFASAKLQQIINEGKGKTNEKPSLSGNNEGNE